MGAVFSARHIHLGERVAIKLLLPEMIGNVDVIERFGREARAAARIQNEHVARVLDVGMLPLGTPFMVMEYLEGTDLRGRLDAGEPIPIAQAVDFILQACEAIAEAHSLRIIHRDLKPENLFCVQRRDGGFTIKVLDFGISKVCTTASGGIVPALTRSIGLVGTPHYASPEQIVASRDVDIRTDIWSLGIVLFELLTNRMPFVGAAAIALYAKSAKNTVTPMRNFRASVPEGLDVIVSRCLGRKPDQRYASVAELALALAPFGSASARQSVERICGVLGVKIEVPGVAGFTQKRPLKRFWLIALLLAPIVVTVAAVAYLGSVLTSASKVNTQGPSPSVSHATLPPNLAVPTTSVAATLTIVSTSNAQIPQPEISAEPLQAPTLTTPSKSLILPRRSVGPQPVVPATGTTRAGTNERKPLATNCDPPYFLDEQGRKHFKPECFSK
jgi:serine/threonine-protein kinase